MPVPPLGTWRRISQGRSDSRWRPHLAAAHEDGHGLFDPPSLAIRPCGGPSRAASAGDLRITARRPLPRCRHGGRVRSVRSERGAAGQRRRQVHSSIEGADDDAVGDACPPTSRRSAIECHCSGGPPRSHGDRRCRPGSALDPRCRASVVRGFVTDGTGGDRSTRRTLRIEGNAGYATHTRTAPALQESAGDRRRPRPGGERR
jgi:hypothetical protein